MGAGMTAVIYEEEGCLCLCRVRDHAETPQPDGDVMERWSLTVLAILRQGYNAHVSDPLVLGSAVELEGIKGNALFGALCFQVHTTVRRSALAYMAPVNPAHAAFYDALSLLTDDEKSALLEEARV